MYYTCSSPDLGTFKASAIHRIVPEDRLRRTGTTTEAPVDVVYGGWVKVTTTLRLPAKVVHTLNSQYVEALDGGAVTSIGLAGTALAADDQWADKTPVPGSGAMKLVADGYANVEPAGVNAGRTANLRIADVSGSDFTAQLNPWFSGSRSDTPMAVSCELVDKQDRHAGALTVTKAPVDSRSSITYDSGTGEVVSRVGLWAVYSTATPEGTIKLVLKDDNGERIDAMSGTVQDGGAVMRTTAPPDVHYQLIAKFDGGRNFGDMWSSWGSTPH